MNTWKIRRKAACTDRAVSVNEHMEDKTVCTGRTVSVNEHMEVRHYVLAGQ